MKRQIIEKTATTTARPSAVFDRLLDAASWPEWSGHDRGRVLTAAATPGAVDEVRVFEIGKKRNVERVTESIRPRRFSYVLVEGLPLRNYVANVDIEPVDGGTRITWHSEFEGANPLAGFIYQKGLGRFLTRMLKGLTTMLDAEVTAGSDDPANHH